MRGHSCVSFEAMVRWQHFTPQYRFICAWMTFGLLLLYPIKTLAQVDSFPLYRSSIPAVGREQQLQDNRLGIKVSDASQFYPYLQLDNHWLSNPGRLSENGIDDLATTVRFGMDWILHQHALDAFFSGDVAYQRLWGLIRPISRNLSALTAHLDFELQFNQRGLLGLLLREQYRRRADAANQSITQRLLHNVSQTAADLLIRPWHSSIRSILGYQFYVDLYDSQTTSNPQSLPNPDALSNYRHIADARLQWYFLPETFLLVEPSCQWIHFLNNTGNNTVSNPNAILMQFQTGLKGILFQQWQTTLLLGYAQDNFQTADPLHMQTFVGHAEVSLTDVAERKWRLGIKRSLEPTALFHAFIASKFYMSAEQDWRKQTKITVAPEFQIFDFGLPLVSSQTTGRDLSLAVHLALKHSITATFAISLLNYFEWRISNRYASGYPIGYIYNDILLRLEWDP